MAHGVAREQNGVRWVGLGLSIVIMDDLVKPVKPSQTCGVGRVELLAAKVGGGIPARQTRPNRIKLNQTKSNL
jgi:hypothetical protein